jgi:hypothetical protein
LAARGAGHGDRVALLSENRAATAYREIEGVYFPGLVTGPQNRSTRSR